MLKQVIILLAVCSLAYSQNAPDLVKKAERNLANLLVKSTASIERNPTQGMACFQIYTPKTNALTTEYERNYTECIKTAQMQHYALDLEVKDSRNYVISSGAMVCEDFRVCNRQTNTETFFECYMTASHNASTTTGNMEKTSRSMKQTVKFRSDAISYQEGRCLTAAADTYETQSNQYYEELHECLERL